MTKLIFQTELTLIKQMNQKNGIDINKTNESKKCKFCHYCCFLNKNFKYGPYLCVMVVMIYHKNQQILKILILLILKKVHTEFIFNI